MIIDFRQGIVDYDTTTFPFVVSGGGTVVSLTIGTRPITLTIAQAGNNYTFTEPANVPAAWVGLNATGQSWLYWDFNTATLVRTFGFTTLRPVAQATAPLNPVTGQMWYNTSTFHNYVYQNGGWTEVLRVFAAEYNGNTLPPFQFISQGDQPPLPSGYPNFTGTQIGVNQVGVASGFPLYDVNGVVIRQSTGTFLTTENEMFAQGAPVTGVRLESNVYTAFSSDVTTIPAYAVVSVQPSGTFQLGSYNDAGNTAIAMAVQNIPAGGSGAVCLEGTLTNVLWNWTGYIGQLLWISGTQPGQLVTTDPHVSNPIAFPVKQPPVARVLSQDTIIFLQGIGTQGPPGTPGSGGNNTPATPTVQGVVYLSTDGGLFPFPTNTVVADGDPRLTNARLATANSTLAATNITVAPYTPTNTYAANVQLALQAIANNTLNLTGGTLTGNLILNADPTVPFQAATKHYVDTNFLSIETEVVLITGSTMTGPLILSGNPTASLQAATKQYVDNVAEGITFQAAVTAASTADMGGIYAGNPNYTLTEIGNGVLVVDGVNMQNGQRVLVKNQTTASQNGVYDVTDAGSISTPWVLTRDPAELPPNNIVSGTFVFVNEGAQNISTGWVLSTSNPITLDTTPLSFVQFSSAANVTYSSVISALGYIPVGPFPVSGSAGINVSGSPVSGASPSGPVLSLSTELVGLNNLSASGYGFVQRTGVGSYVATALTAGQVTTALGYIPLASRTINTTAPLAGGGPLTGDLTLTINQFTGTGPGAVPTSPGGTTAFLRADGQWAAPPGGGGGGVSSVGASTSSTGFIIGGTNPITTSGTLTFNLNAELQALAGLNTTGVVQRTGPATYIVAPYTTTLTGDITGSGYGSFATTLATVNSTTGTFGDSTDVAQITVNGKGLVTAVTNVPISIAGLLPSQTGNTGDFLQTNGSTLSWAPAVVSAAGSNTQIQFNNGGAFGASAGLTWDDAVGNRTLTLGESTDGTSYITTHANATGLVDLSISGGNVSISAGTPSNPGTGNYIEITGGSGTSASNGYGGNVTISGGAAPSAGLGGAVAIIGGNSVTGDGGSVTMSGGSSGSAFGGSVIIQTTPDNNSHYVNRLAITSFGEWQVNGSSSTIGQRITSNGPGTSPTWQSGQLNDVIFATSGQTVVTLTNVTATSKFPAGTTAYVKVYLNGIQQREDNSTGNAYTIEGSFYVSAYNQITFFNPLSLNDEVTVYQL